MTKNEKRAYHDAHFAKFNAEVTAYPELGFRAGKYNYTRRLASGCSDAAVKIEDFETAYKWDGRARFFDHND